MCGKPPPVEHILTVMNKIFKTFLKSWLKSEETGNKRARFQKGEGLLGAGLTIPDTYSLVSVTHEAAGDRREYTELEVATRMDQRLSYS